MEKLLDTFIQKQGWSFYGITDIETVRAALKKHKIVFDEWAGKRYIADMDYLKRMEGDRFKPEAKLPDVKSMIVMGAVYSNGYRIENRIEINPKSIRNQSGKVAKYARGRDYHRILKKRLVKLADFLKNQKSKIKNRKLPVHTYVSVDSGPTVDRVLAEVAGLGFFGKNCNLINPPAGSYFFIASLMTNLELPLTKKPPMPGCGNCQNCLKNCPTGALVSPGVLDARKCVSYLTIENKGRIPADLRPKIGNRIFGCDACQECCPFNIRDLRLKIKDFSPESGAGESLNLKDVLSVKTDEEFLKKFAGTPLMRAKRRGLIRNACIVAGNSGDISLISYLKAVIERENDDMLKEHAAWALERLIPPD